MNKTFIRNLAIGMVAVGMLFGLGYTASKTVPAIAQYVTSKVDVLLPDPTPTPTNVPTPVPTVAPSIAPIVQVTPPQPATPSPEPFPPQAVIATPPSGASPSPQIPQTFVFVGIQDNGTSTFDVNTGGRLCTGPCTIVWQACFQGGFTGSMVELCGAANTDPGLTFTWSNGHVGSTDSVTYSTPGVTRVTVSVSEAYQGHIYAAGSANGVPITVVAVAPPPAPSPIPTS